MEDKETLFRKIAWLESRLDHVESELIQLDQLLVNCGFPEGIESLKLTIEELLDETAHHYPPDDQVSLGS